MGVIAGWTPTLASSKSLWIYVKPGPELESQIQVGPHLDFKNPENHLEYVKCAH